MPLKRCHQCGNEFTIDADKCPRCGTILPKPFMYHLSNCFRWIIKASIACVVLFFAVGWVLSIISPTRERPKNPVVNASPTEPATNEPVATSPKQSADLSSESKTKVKTTSNIASKSNPESATSMSSGEEAGLKLLALKSAGLLDLIISDLSLILEVEPLAWQGLTHNEKKILCGTGMEFSREMNKRDGKHIGFVHVWNMTTREDLAKGSLIDGSISVYK